MIDKVRTKVLQECVLSEQFPPQEKCQGNWIEKVIQYPELIQFWIDLPISGLKRNLNRVHPAIAVFTQDLSSKVIKY